MNKITYNGYTFRDANATSGNLTLANSMIGDILEADTLTFTLSNVADRYVLKDADGKYLIDANGNQLVYFSDVADFENYIYGAPVEFFHNDELLARFYLNSAKRVSRNLYEIYCTSAVGMLINLTHKGGIYAGETAGEIIEGLMGGYPYSIDEEVASVEMYGHLPYGNCRDNLHQVLFAIGASITKDSQGGIAIKYMVEGQPIQVPMNRTGNGGTVSYPKKASQIDVTEHSFYALNSDKEVLLFDNVAKQSAVHQLVTFTNPCHDLTADGLTIEESGVNYAIVSGTGILSGKEYTHTTLIVSHSTGASGGDKVVAVKDATLVSTLNSQNVSKRLSGYYSSAMQVDCDIIVDDVPIKPATEVSFADPFGENHTGFVNSMNINVSGILKSQTQITVGWTPSNFGNNTQNHVVITESGTVDIPEGVETVRAVLIGGGNGGMNGENGGAGSRGTSSHQYGATGGAGGNGGAGGSGGKINTIDIPISGATTFNISIGTGGSANGGIGGNTTLTANGQTYTSAYGQPSSVGVVDIVSGNVYGLSGAVGYKGADGGGQRDDGYHRNGDPFSADGQTWQGGVGGQDLEFDHEWRESGTLYTRVATSLGGQGGGACYGSAGGNGKTGRLNAVYESRHEGGDGGDGGTPTPRANATVIGCGGDGGHGGGGGGAGGNSFKYEGVAYQQHTYGSWGLTGFGGNGGSGGLAGAGANGGVILYY